MGNTARLSRAAPPRPPRAKERNGRHQHHRRGRPPGKAPRAAAARRGGADGHERGRPGIHHPDRFFHRALRCLVRLRRAAFDDHRRRGAAQRVADTRGLRPACAGPGEQGLPGCRPSPHRVRRAGRGGLQHRQCCWCRPGAARPAGCGQPGGHRGEWLPGHRNLTGQGGVHRVRPVHGATRPDQDRADHRSGRGDRAAAWPGRHRRRGTGAAAAAADPHPDRRNRRRVHHLLRRAPLDRQRRHRRGERQADPPRGSHRDPGGLRTAYRAVPRVLRRGGKRGAPGQPERHRRLQLPRRLRTGRAAPVSAWCSGPPA